MVITLVILAVAAALSIPALLRESTPPELDDAQARLEALFSMARDSAVRSATPVTVTVDSASGLVWLDARTRQSAEMLGGPMDAGEPGHDPGIQLRREGAFGGGSTLGGGLGAPGASSAAPLRGDRLALPPAVRMELLRARAHFTFSASGAAVGDTILLRSSTGQLRVITLDPWSGHVRAR